MDKEATAVTVQREAAPTPEQRVVWVVSQVLAAKLMLEVSSDTVVSVRARVTLFRIAP